MNKKSGEGEIKVSSGIVLDLRNLAANLMELNIQQNEGKISKKQAEEIMYEYAMKLIDLEEQFVEIGKHENNVIKGK